MALNPANCTQATQSAVSLTDDETGKGSPYCIIVPTFVAAMDSRYDGETCIAPNTPAQIHSRYNVLKASTTSQDNLVTNMNSGLNTPLANAKLVYDGLFDSKAEIESLQERFKKVNALLDPDQGGLTAFANCTVIRFEARNLIGNACFGFVQEYDDQTFYFGFFGPILLFCGIFLFCNYIVTNESTVAAIVRP